MKISIIIPAYNAEKYIERCVNSIINQTYKNIEIIIVNDGSTDMTKEKVEKIKDDRIIILNQENFGVSSARNIGIKKATGMYIMFVDSDDYIEKDTVEKVINVISNTNVDIVKFNYNNLDKENKIEPSQENYEQYENKELKRNEILEFMEEVLKGKVNAFVWTLALKREIANNINFNTKLGMMEDLLFYIETLPKIKNMYIINDRMYNYCINEESVSNSNKYYYKNFIDTLEACNQIINSLKKSNCYNNDRKNMIVLSKMLGIESIFYKICSEKEVQNKVLESMLQNEELDSIIEEIPKLYGIAIQRKINIKLIKKKRKRCLIIFNKIRYRLSKLKK